MAKVDNCVFQQQYGFKAAFHSTGAQGELIWIKITDVLRKSFIESCITDFSSEIIQVLFIWFYLTKVLEKFCFIYYKIVMIWTRH